MAVKGFYDNPQEATTPASTDLLGIQQGDTLADMKKITYENLVKPLEEAKLDKIATPVENAIVVQNADGTLKNSNVDITDPTFDSVGADEFDTGSQVVEAAMIPSTTDEMLRLKNTQAGKVHTIMELRSPDTGDTEATLSLHTVPNGIDDWVFDLSFHNYSTFMKMVSVISHFTGENAGSWEWVSRYTDGTDYSMIERMLMKLDGQTGYLMVGENGDATARFHAKQVGYLDKPAIKAEVDSTHETQPPALHATDTTNHAQTGVLVKFSMLNATDTGVVLKLENAGTGDYINADGKFVVDKDGKITSPTIDAIKGTGYTYGTLKTHEDRLDTLEGTGEGSVAKAIDDAVSPLAELVDTNRLYSDSQYLALKAQADAQALEIQASRAELYNGYKILQFGSTDIIGKGTKADYSAIDVSANVVDGKLSMEQKGLTIRNLVVNGGLDSGTTGWTPYSTGALSVDGDYIKSATVDETSSIGQSIVPIVGDKYFIACIAKVSTTPISDAKFVQAKQNVGVNVTATMAVDTTDTFCSAIITGASDRNFIGFGRSATIQTLFIKKNSFILVNLTALGLDHITDTTILSKLLPYVDGTKNVGKMGVLVRGVNQAKKDIKIGTISTADGLFYPVALSASAVCYVYYMPVMPNSTYTLSNDKSYSNTFIFAYDKYMNFIKRISTSPIVTPSNCRYLRFRSSADGTQIDTTVNYMLNLGSSALPYEPYQEQLTFLPAIGNSLPNGVADSIKTVADGWEHVKRVERYDLINESQISLYATGSNTYGFFIAYNAGYQLNATTGVVSNNDKRFSYVAGVDDNEHWYYFYDTVTPTIQVRLFVMKASIDAYSGASVVEKFVAWATATQAHLLYKLATPVITHYDLPLPTSGKTIHRFAGEEKIALYGTGLTFSENVLSVLSAIKFVAGEMTDITSLATITDDTVTFSGVSATDVVYVKVEHDVDRPLGILEHTPAVSNTASRLAAIEAWIAAQGA